MKSDPVSKRSLGRGKASRRDVDASASPDNADRSAPKTVALTASALLDAGTTPLNFAASRNTRIERGDRVGWDIIESGETPIIDLLLAANVIQLDNFDPFGARQTGPAGR